MSEPPLRFRVWSDYLCPWCFNASVRLHRLRDELAGRIELEWRSFLLRPHAPRALAGRSWTASPPEAGAQRASEEAEGRRAAGERSSEGVSARREAFRVYTESWLRPAAEPDAGRFRVWEGEAGPPSHSVPAHVAAKAAARIGPEAFERLHARLLEAYFAENRDISDEATLRALWEQGALPEAAFPHLDDDALVRAVFADHASALDAGATGVPAVQLVGNDAVIVGAHPLALYRRWAERALARRGDGDTRETEEARG